MPRKATIGPAVYQRVNELVKEGKSRSEAFVQVGQERGQRPGTVAANYYRTARAQGQPGQSSSTRTRRRRSTRPTAAPTRRQRATRSTTSTRTSSRGSDNGAELDALAAQITTLTQQLVKQIEERDARLRQLLG